MIRYRYKNAKILFVGINPHPGSFRRGVPFSNNKLFWYLLSDAGLISESRAELKDDRTLKELYEKKFNTTYRLGFVNIIDRPTVDVTGLKKGEEIAGQKRLRRIVASERPPIICFIGKIAYATFTGKKEFRFGWQEDIGDSRTFVMHFPLHGKAIVRVHELRKIGKSVPTTK